MGIAADCSDGYHGNSCKEATLIAEAAQRNATWLFIVGEDNYVDTKMVEAALQQMPSHVPVGLGCIGCGIRNPKYGENVRRVGGFCGGCGEAISQAALERLAAGGRSALVLEYGDETQGDMSTSHAMLDRGIHLKSFPGHLTGTPVIKQQLLGKMVDDSIATFHYMTPATMRWLHAKRNRANQQEIQTMAAEAFEHGCVRGMNSAWFASEVQECLNETRR